MTYDDIFEPDFLLDDESEILLGNTKIKCIATPGHTPGCMSYIFDVTDGEVTYTAGLHGGMGLNTMCREFLDKCNLPYDLRDRFFEAMDRLAKVKVDIFLGNHMKHNNTTEKTKCVKDGNTKAFINPMEWERYVLWCKENLQSMIEKENGND